MHHLCPLLEVSPPQQGPTVSEMSMAACVGVTRKYRKPFSKSFSPKQRRFSLAAAVMSRSARLVHKISRARMH